MHKQEFPKMIASDAKFLRHVADLVRLENSAGRCKFRMDLADGVVFATDRKVPSINIQNRQ